MDVKLEPEECCGRIQVGISLVDLVIHIDCQKV